MNFDPPPLLSRQVQGMYSDSDHSQIQQQFLSTSFWTTDQQKV